MKVLIVGAGLGGLCLAHCLQKAGIDVLVFERRAQNGDEHAGYGIHLDANGRRALRSCIPAPNWAAFQQKSTTAGTQLFFRDTNLRVLAERDDAKVSGQPAREVERRAIGRMELRDLLLYGLADGPSPRIRWNSSFSHYIQLDDGRVRVHFEGDTTEEGDVLVGADGANSKVRQQYLPDVERLDLGIAAIAGRCVLDERSLEGLPTEMINGSLNNIVPSSRGWMFVSSWNLPDIKSHANKDKKSLQMVWAFVSSQEELPLDVDRLKPRELQQLVIQGIRDWSPALKNLVMRADKHTISLIPLRCMPFLDPWTPSNITVLGDAIHNMTPMAGVGANTALRDAELLTEVLVDAAAGSLTVTEAIGLYEEKMRLYANNAVGLSRRNAESASSGHVLQRRMFRTLLRAAQTFPVVMRKTTGRSAMVRQ
ncbi:hypothetical protein H2200_009742 [Cladophialophora chaetospira]|uniref:FAD-binding domain-containing protein n=1 Tax=Cladophialophora chaetospira TaxID=386627 RepID=A0AA38X385_9EURO|nr:hypothetical protein H2200_009742 [Cladophialophora chaetospira]